MMSSLIAVPYCYQYLLDQIPIGLLLYTHIPTALLALVFGGYVLWKDRRGAARLLFFLCAAFALCTATCQKT